MSILSKMGKLFELATSDAKSSDIEIDELIQYSEIDIPHEFLEIIEEKTELEILVNNKKYIPDSLAIGDDECSNAVLYANGNNGFGLYIVSFSDLDVDEMVYIADSLEAFFVNEEGIDIFNNIW